METKSIFESWTFWFGIAQLVYGGIGLVSGLMEYSTALTTIVTGLGTIGFRIKTDTAVR